MRRTNLRERVVFCGDGSLVVRTGIRSGVLISRVKVVRGRIMCPLLIRMWLELRRRLGLRQRLLQRSPRRQRRRPRGGRLRVVGRRRREQR